MSKEVAKEYAYCLAQSVKHWLLGAEEDESFHDEAKTILSKTSLDVQFALAADKLKLLAERQVLFQLYGSDSPDYIKFMALSAFCHSRELSKGETKLDI